DPWQRTGGSQDQNTSQEQSGQPDRRARSAFHVRDSSGARTAVPARGPATGGCGGGSTRQAFHLHIGAAIAPPAITHSLVADRVADAWFTRYLPEVAQMHEHIRAAIIGADEAESAIGLPAGEFPTRSVCHLRTKKLGGLPKRTLCPRWRRCVDTRDAWF